MRVQCIERKASESVTVNRREVLLAAVLLASLPASGSEAGALLRARRLGRRFRRELGLTAGTSSRAALTALLARLPGLTVERSDRLNVAYALPGSGGKILVTVPAHWSPGTQADSAMSLIGQALILPRQQVETGMDPDSVAFGNAQLGEAFRLAFLTP